MKTTHQFIEIILAGNLPPRCVDGRPAADTARGPQMLGGSLHPILLHAIFFDEDFDTDSVSTSAGKLQQAGFKIGAHRGEPSHGGSGCGFADQLPSILATVIANQALISERLVSIYNENRKHLESAVLPPFRQMLTTAFDKIEKYNPDRIKITGDALIKKLEENSATIETVQKDHFEEVAFVNTKREVTLDTIALNQQGKQAFNLDMTQVNLQSESIGVPMGFTIPVSMILYMATEMVLVEQKGKSPLPIEIHS